MIEERNFKLEDIKKIKLNRDCENVIFPKNIIKNFSYVYNSEKNNYYKDGLYLSEAYLEVDLDYVMNEYAYFENIKQNDRKIIDLIKLNSVWYIVVVTNDNNEYILEVPFYNKDLYIKEDTNIYNAKNSFEIHKQTKKTYIIKWAYNKDNTRLNIDEMITLFKNKKRKGAPLTKNNFQIEILNRILKLKCDSERIKFLSKFCGISNNEIYKVKSDYKIETEFSDEDDVSICTLKIRNHSHGVNVNFIFVKNNNSKDLINLLETLNKIKDTPNYLNKTIIILDDNINMVDFCKSLDRILSEVICLTLSEMNEFWYEIIYRWGT